MNPKKRIVNMRRRIRMKKRMLKKELKRIKKRRHKVQKRRKKRMKMMTNKRKMIMTRRMILRIAPRMGRAKVKKRKEENQLVIKNQLMALKRFQPPSSKQYLRIRNSTKALRASFNGGMMT